jgi:radical SAM protein with 4Fe4S-binding SPASM domain
MTTEHPGLLPIDSLAVRPPTTRADFDVDVHLTNRCTLRCVHCAPDSGVMKMREHDPVRLRDALERLVRVGAVALHIGGGEPFVRRDLMFALIAWGSQKGLQTQVQTNGTLVKDGDIDRLFGSGMDQLLLSLDGDEEAHDRFRQMRGNFAACMSIVEWCTRRGYRLRINAVASKGTCRSIPRMIARLRGTSVTTVSIFNMVPKGRGLAIRGQELSLGEFHAFVQELEAFVRREGISSPRVEVQDILKTRHEIAATGPIRCRIQERTECLIKSDGSVYPCFLLMDDPIRDPGLAAASLARLGPDGAGWGSWRLGNIYEEPADEIWTDPRRWERYERLVLRRRCAGTAVEVPRCGGGCPAYAYLVGHGRQCDTRCEVDQGGFLPGCFCLRRPLGAGAPVGVRRGRP